MSKPQNLHARKILAVVQTPAELRWFYSQIEQQDVQYLVLLLGDAITEYSANKINAENLQVLYLQDLDINNEEIWRMYNVVKDELIADTGSEINEQLETVNQINFEMSFSDMLYINAAVEAVLDFVEPDEIFVPPAKISRRQTPFYAGNLQSVFYEAARRRNLQRNASFSTRLVFIFNPLITALQQLFLALFAFFWDVKRYTKYLFSRSANLEKWQNAILIVNHAHDLPRQFDLPAFAETNKEKCVVWNWLTSEIQTLEDYLSENDAEKLIDAQIARQNSPVRSTDLFKKYWSKIYCSLFAGESDENLRYISEMMSSRGLANEKLLNWRRIVYSARLAAKASDVLEVLKPKMLVASEYTDVSRATSLAARSLDVPVLATAHGINMYKPAMQGTYALGDVHCFFGADKGGHLVEFDLPGVETVRLIAHDNFKKLDKKTKNNFTKAEKRRVFIVTSMLSCSFPNWTNEIFVKWLDYEKMMRELLENLSAYSDEIEVVIKSHPLLDAHHIYDELKEEFPDLLIRHWREPINVTDMIPADIVVIYNCVSTLTFTAIDQNLPIIGFWGAMTPLALRNVVVNELYGTDDAAKLAEIILDIARSPDGETARKTRECAAEMSGKFIEPTDIKLADAVEITLELGKR